VLRGRSLARSVLKSLPMDDRAHHCPYLEEDLVPICGAFQGGLRTPREREVERVCRTSGHESCPLFAARERLETGARPGRPGRPAG